MSVVSSVILTCSLAEENGEDNFPAINFINNWLREENKGTFTHINPHAGGNKAMQIDAFAGAFNYLNMERFAKVLLQAPWEEIESVTVFINGEQDEAMRQVLLTEQDDADVFEHNELREALKNCRIVAKQSPTSHKLA